ncbi:MAG: CHAT domain-containing protein [Magnetococcales bacterium]|nr:CHAT domain-containing protein [Magnetococcales bacterium]
MIVSFPFAYSDRRAVARRWFWILLPVLFSADLFLSGCASDKTMSMRVLVMSGRYTQAAAYFEENLDIESVDHATLQDLCRSYYEMKRYEAFQRCSDRYLERVRAQGGDDVFFLAQDGTPTSRELMAPVLTWRALVGLEIGDYPQALVYAQEILNLLQREPQTTDRDRWLAQAERVAGLAAALQGHRGEAQMHLKRLENLIPVQTTPGLRAAFHTASIQIGMALKDYLQVRQAIEEYDRVNTIEVLMMAASWVNPLQGAINALSELGRRDAEERSGAWLVALPRRFMHARACLETADLDCARKAFDALLLDTRLPILDDLYWMTLYDRGRIAVRDGHPEQAIGWWERAIAAMEAEPVPFHGSVAETGVTGDRQEVYRQFIALLYQQGAFAQAFAVAERAKALGMTDLLARSTSLRGVRPNRSPQVKRLLATLAEVNDQISRRDGRRTAADRERLHKNRTELLERLSELDYSLAANLGARPLTLARIQEQLPRDETLVAYHQYASGHFLAFVVSRTEFHCINLPDVRPESGITALRQALKTPDGDRWRQPAQTLYRKLWAPLQDQVKTGKVTIVPHGSLFYLPFAVLLDDSNVGLIDRYDLRLLPSANASAYFPLEKRGKEGRFVAIGDPKRPSEEKWSPMPMARDEALAIAVVVAMSDEHLQAQVFLGDLATRGTLKGLEEGYRYMHLAAPLSLRPTRPLDSAILFTPEPGGDGRLTVREMYDLGLDADLLTLSATELPFAGGDSGEAVPALMHGLLFGFGNSALFGLWRLDAEGSLLFIRRYFQFFREDGDKRAALRHAQIALRHEERAHPHYWAGFQLIGLP